ncbi:hypothetical protein K466DRAFT_277688 [Polyporus arcularius HHB13444]|uniref:Uncharacterized protein n=1 Tax=Polyporus arcularius HHB13444 TaxID=1314778 RepID=A0A5C3P051_9APHY|nr:hypothetical protein K466DRAFT_277688 [Polyporus arcularius HHB13444]
MTVEQKLVSEIGRRRQAENEARIMEHERDALAIQLASKQETLNELMNEFETLEDDLQVAKRSFKSTEHDLCALQTLHDSALEGLTTLKAAYTGALEDITTLKADLEALRKSTCPISEVETLRAEVEFTNRSLVQLQATLDEQSGALDLCRTTLRSTSEERDHLRDSLDSLYARHKLAEDLEDTLLQTLEERDVEISGLEAELVGRDATIAAHASALADRDTTICAYKAALAARDIALADRDATLAQADAALAVCQASFVERDATAAAQDRKLVELQTYIVGLEGVVEFLKIEASAARVPGSPVKVAPRSHSTSPPPDFATSASPTRSSLCRTTSTASWPMEKTSMPSTPQLPAPLMLPRRSSSSTSSPTSSPGSNWGSPRRFGFF